MSRGTGKQSGLLLDEPLIFERSRPGRAGFALAGGDVEHRRRVAHRSADDVFDGQPAPAVGGLGAE